MQAIKPFEISGQGIKISEQGIKIIDTIEPQCSWCDRVPTCGVFRAIEPLMNGWDEKLRPFDAQQIAKICQWFIRAPGQYTLHEKR